MRAPLRRLHINFSCRVRQRAACVAVSRAELTALLRRVAVAERRLDPAGLQERKARSAKRVLRLEQRLRRELRLGVPARQPRDDKDEDDSSSGGGDVSSEDLEKDSSELAWPLSVAELRAACPTYARTRSCEHLCAHMCYYREHEPARNISPRRV